jgi:long-chain fatty acid transport protein
MAKMGNNMKQKSIRKKTQVAGGKQLNRALYLAALALVPAAASAEGFRNATIGTFDLGRSGGRIAQVDDASAVQNNPANLVDVATAQAALDPSVIYMNVDYKSPDGSQSASTLHPIKALPDIFASIPFDDNRFAVGLGITVPFGLASQWSTSSSAFARPTGRLAYTTANFGKLTTFNFNPAFSAKLGDHVQIGVGLDVMWSELEFRQYLPAPLPNLQAHASGDGVGVGGNLGVTWKITDSQRLALTYRSTMTVDYSGTTKFENYLVGLPDTSFNSQIKFPNIISAGYGIDLTDKIRLESDVEWLQFSQFKNLGVNIGNNALGVPSQNIAEKWHNTFTAGIGGDWKFADHWVLRAGYEYFESPVPDSTFTPTIPDANQNVLTLGIGWHGQHSSLEFAYGLDFYNDRNITNDQNPALNGKYTFNVHLFSFAYRYSF